MSRKLLWVALVACAACSACKDPKGGKEKLSESEKELVDKVVSAKGASSTSAPAPTTTALTGMPELTIDELGAYIGGRRADKLTKPEGKKRLKEIIEDLPIEKSPVTIDVAKKAKVPDVGIVVEAFGRAGAPQVIVKTEGRADLPKELTLTPLVHVKKPPVCSVVASINEDLIVAVWTLKGGGGGKFRKGWAGPDLTHAQEGIEKRLEQCQSSTAFFSTHHSHPWQMAFNMGGSIVKADPDGNIKQLVLLGEEPVGGRPVELEFKK